MAGQINVSADVVAASMKNLAYVIDSVDTQAASLPPEPSVCAVVPDSAARFQASFESAISTLHEVVTTTVSAVATNAQDLWLTAVSFNAVDQDVADGLGKIEAIAQSTVPPIVVAPAVTVPAWPSTSAGALPSF